MRYLFSLILLVSFAFSCTKDVYKNPTEAEEDKYFDLWVKNPNTFECAILLNHDLVGIATPNSHEIMGNFLQTDTLHLRALINDYPFNIIKADLIPMDYWRKQSFTFYLPDTTIP